MKKVLYTAIMGRYDQLKPPKFISDSWDYVCFTDNYKLKNDLWQIRYIDSDEYGATKTARWVKICNQLFLSEYDLSIWIDGSFEINCYLDEFVENYHKGTFSVMTHGRDCVYAEAKACINKGKDKDVVIKRQMDGYRNQGYPENNGMVATGLIIRNNCEKNNIFAKHWWREVRLNSKRDQLSFNYTLWKHPIDVNIMDFHQIIRNYFLWGKHGI